MEITQEGAPVESKRSLELFNTEGEANQNLADGGDSGFSVEVSHDTTDSGNATENNGFSVEIAKESDAPQAQINAEPIDAQANAEEPLKMAQPEQPQMNESINETQIPQSAV